MKTKNKTSCAFFWTQLHIEQREGNVYPCCISTSPDMKLGNINTHNIQEIWDNPKLKEMRVKSLKGEIIEGCFKCNNLYESGQESLRDYANQNIPEKAKTWMKETSSEGESPNSKPIAWDIRFSNVCNFKCRICSGTFSSKWFDEETKLGISFRKQAVLKSIQDLDKFFTDFDQYLPEMESIYFAGGEPLFIEEHYIVLDKIMERGITPSIIYNTNLSTFTYRKKSILDIWNKLGDKLSIQASLDASGSRAEYIRSGTNWTQIEANLKELKEKCPKAKLIINPTLGIFNALHLPEFHREMVDKGFIKPEQWQINYLQTPYYMNAKNFIDSDKKELSKLYFEHITWLKTFKKSPEIDNVIEQYKNSITFIIDEDQPKEHEKFVGVTKDLDKLRNEKFTDVFPELRNMWVAIT